MNVKNVGPKIQKKNVPVSPGKNCKPHKSIMSDCMEFSIDEITDIQKTMYFIEKRQLLIGVFRF